MLNHQSNWWERVQWNLDRHAAAVCCYLKLFLYGGVEHLPSLCVLAETVGRPRWDVCFGPSHNELFRCTCWMPSRANNDTMFQCLVSAFPHCCQLFPSSQIYLDGVRVWLKMCIFTQRSLCARLHDCVSLLVFSTTIFCTDTSVATFIYTLSDWCHACCFNRSLCALRLILDFVLQAWT